MTKKLHRMTLTEELEFYAQEIKNSVDNEVIFQNKNRETKLSFIREKLPLVKKTSKEEIYNYLLDSLSEEIVKTHLKSKEIQKQETYKINENILKETFEEIKITNSNGYLNGIFTEGSTEPVIIYNKNQQKVNRLGYQKPSNLINNVVFQQRLQMTEFNKQLIKDNPIKNLIGDPTYVANELIKANDLEWPTIAWHEGKVKYNSVRDISKFKKKIKYYEISLLPYLHVVLSIGSILIFLTLLSSLINTLENKYSIDEYFYQMLVYPKIIWYYGWLSLLYPRTISLMRSSYFNYIVDNSARYIKMIKTIAKIHITVFTVYILYLLRSSFIISQNTSDIFSGFNYTISHLIRVITFPTIIFYYFMYSFNHHISQEYKNKIENIQMKDQVAHKGVMLIFILLFRLNLLTFAMIVEIFVIAKYKNIYLNVTTLVILSSFQIGILFFTVIILLLLKKKPNLLNNYDWFNDIKDFNLIMVVLNILSSFYILFTKIRISKYSSDRDYNWYLRNELTYGKIVFFMISMILLTVIIYLYFDKIYEKLTSTPASKNRITLTEIKTTIIDKYKKIKLGLYNLFDKYQIKERFK